MGFFPGIFKPIVDFTGGVVLVWSDGDEPRNDPRIEGDYILRITRPGGGCETFKVRRRLCAIHRVRPVTPIKPPTVNPIAPTHRPVADDLLPLRLKFLVGVRTILPLQRLSGSLVAGGSARRQIGDQFEPARAQRFGGVQHQVALRTLAGLDAGQLIVGWIGRQVVTGVLPDGQDEITRADGFHLFSQAFRVKAVHELIPFRDRHVEVVIARFPIGEIVDHDAPLGLWHPCGAVCGRTFGCVDATLAYNQNQSCGEPQTTSPDAA